MNSEFENIGVLIDSIKNQMETLMARPDRQDPLLIGIHSGGVWIAEKLHKQLSFSEPLGKLNIAFYRDDFSRIGMHPRVAPSNLPFGVEDRHIILVDDVLYTGRTIRAAMNEIFDYGRPLSISLAVLIERSGRELPIQPDIVGKRIELKNKEHVKLTGPEPLALVINKAE